MRGSEIGAGSVVLIAAHHDDPGDLIRDPRGLELLPTWTRAPRIPDTDPKYRGADSRTFLEAAVAKAASMGYRVVNVDATVILERPKLSPQKEAVRASLAGMLGVEASRVNVKGKTHETLDALGRGEGVEVHAVVLMARE